MTPHADHAPIRLGVLTSVGRTLDAFFPELVAAWTARGVTVFTAAGDPSHHFDSAVIPGLTQSPSLGNLGVPAQLARWIESNSLDAVLTNTAVASALVRLRRPKVPLIYFCHGLHWSRNAQFSPIWKSIEAILARNTRAAIVSNSEDEEWLTRRLGKDRVLRLEHGVGVPIERFPRTPMPPLSDELQLAWIGQMSARKRPILAVEVAEYLRDWGVPFHLRMAGTGALQAQVRAAVARAGLQEHVSLIDRVPSSTLLQDVHAILHTSAWEGLARVLLEAAAIGRNAYGFDVKGVRDAPSIALARDGDPRALADMIRTDFDEGLPGQQFPNPSEMTVERYSNLTLDQILAWLRAP